MVLAFAPFAWLTHLVSNHWWTYPLVFAAVVLDADLPIVPSETVIVTAAIAAHAGHLSVWVVGLAAALGGIVGDNISYALGAFVGRPAFERLFHGEKSRRRYDWSKEKLERQGVWIVPAARFVPGGRTAITFAAGTTAMTWRRFAIADAVAACVWAFYATALGYFGGAAFGTGWRSFALALGIGAVVGLAGFAYYRLAGGE